jgi:hypothetical protein
MEYKNLQRLSVGSTGGADKSGPGFYAAVMKHVFKIVRTHYIPIYLY